MKYLLCSAKELGYHRSRPHCFPVVNEGVKPLLRKNSLFAGSEQSGQRGCYISSLIEPAKANGLNPSEWLTDVLTRLLNTKDKQIRQFLPTCWKPPS